MPDQPGAGRLDPETLAAYVDGLLPPEERARVDAEIAADPENFEWLVNTIGAVDDDTMPGSALPAPPGRAGRRVGAAGRGRVGRAGGATAARVVAAPARSSGGSEVRHAGGRSGTRALHRGETQRRIRIRTTATGRCAGQTTSRLTTSRCWRRRASCRRPRTQIRARRTCTPGGWRSCCVGAPDLAVVTLTAALAKESSHAVAIDLAAAYLSDGAASEASLAPDARLRGRLAAALLAPAASARNPVAAFNYALALEQTGDVAAARRAWEVALELQTDAGWRHDVETRLQRLQQARP